MDLQWILDKFLDVAKISSAQEVRIGRAEGDIAGLKGLYDRVKKLETTADVEDDQRHVVPQHRQVLVQIIAIAVSIASVAINIFIYFTTHSK